MKSILLIRHAKSDWALATSDKNRKIAERGIQAAHTIGQKLSKKLPDNYVVYCSTATRARETATILTKYFSDPPPQIVYHEDLYTFSESALTRFIQALPNENSSLILFGHNEAITNFVNKFGSISIANVPTTGSVCIEFPIDSWKLIQKGTTKYVEFP